MKIGLLGGSFDPVHIGHIELAKVAFAKLKLDKMIIVLAYKNPFKKHNRYENDQKRLAMLKIVVPKDWEISEFEIKRQRITYAFEVVNNIYKKENQIYYLIGADNLKNLNKWKEIDTLSSKVKFVCFDRKGYVKNKNIKKYDIDMLNNNQYWNSSTKYKMGNLESVDPKIQDYISSELLYLDTIAFNTLPFKRYSHSKHVALLAKEYAKINNLNTKDAFFAGLIHDFTKYWTIDEHKDILDKHNIDSTDMPDAILHQYSSALWFRYVYCSKNNNIYSAIMKHTTADFEMSTFDKIIYIADKLAVGRKFKGIQDIRALAKKDIDKAFIKVLVLSNEFVIKKHGSISKHAKDIENSWVK